MRATGRQENSNNLAENEIQSGNDCHCRGKLFLVGIGSGSPRQLTPHALEAIRLCDVVVGYKNYLNLIENLLLNKQIIGSGMKQEIQRAEAAIEAALEGKNTAVISSGDAGIYGMAGLVLEIMQKRELDLPVEIVPGITAAVLAAASLGAPLMNDYITMSLSDLMTPWNIIEKRLDLAAQGDWVIALYNPKSHGRSTQIETARSILLKYRDGKTPVGIVYKAGREDEKKTISTLADFTKEPIDMSTIIIIGNSQTSKFNDFMITARGYKV